MTGLLAHNLKNPIIGIRQALQMLVTENHRLEKPTIENTLDDLYSTCDLLLGIVNDMLDVYKYEFDGVNLSLEEIDILEPLDKALWLLRYQIEEKRIRIVKRLEYGITISGDAKRLCRVLLNLLDNALKYSPLGGEIVVMISVASRNNAMSVQIEVQDEGRGIPKQDLIKIFEQFYQASKSDISVEPGSGLGLCYCKMVVEAHGGEIQAENKNGGGAVFTISLPLVRADKSRSGQRNTDAD